MEGSVQQSAIQLWDEFHLQQDCNPGSQDPRLAAITTLPYGYFKLWEQKKHIFSLYLTHCSRETSKMVTGNSADPDQMPHYAASDQGLHCLQIILQFLSRNM